MPKDQQRDATIVVRVPKCLKDRLQKHAAADGKSLSEFLFGALSALANIIDKTKGTGK